MASALGRPRCEGAGWAFSPSLLNMLFHKKKKTEKDKEKKEKVGAESGHEDNFPGLLKMGMVREN